jgi:hypothetical protein
MKSGRCSLTFLEKLLPTSSQPKSKIYSLIIACLVYSSHKDGGGIFLQNVCDLIPDCMVSHPRCYFLVTGSIS